MKITRRGRDGTESVTVEIDLSKRIVNIFSLGLLVDITPKPKAQRGTELDIEFESDDVVPLLHNIVAEFERLRELLSEREDKVRSLKKLLRRAYHVIAEDVSKNREAKKVRRIKEALQDDICREMGFDLFVND